MDFTHKSSRRVDFDFLFHKLRFADRTEISATRFADAFGYNLLDLLQLAHVDQAHVENLRQSPQLQHFMEATLKVMSSASLLLEDADEAIAWFKTHQIIELGGKTPEQLVSSGRQRELIRQLSNVPQVRHSSDQSLGTHR
jgi:pantoate kinase